MANFDLDKYVTVAERLQQFWADHPGGAICTRVEVSTDQVVRVRAEVFRDINDRRPASTGTASERPGDGFVNRTSAIENCETSSVGRALALMGYSVDRGVASREEVEQAQAANKELDRRQEIKAELRRAVEDWMEIGGLEFSNLQEASRVYMKDELGIEIEGDALSPEQWNQLDKLLSSVLAA